METRNNEKVLNSSLVRESAGGRTEPRKRENLSTELNNSKSERLEFQNLEILDATSSIFGFSISDEK